jgi:hypothetical protein
MEPKGVFLSPTELKTAREKNLEEKLTALAVAILPSKFKSNRVANANTHKKQQKLRKPAVNANNKLRAAQAAMKLTYDHTSDLEWLYDYLGPDKHCPDPACVRSRYMRVAVLPSRVYI